MPLGISSAPTLTRPAYLIAQRSVPGECAFDAMASQGDDHWSETDQEIIESLLLVDGSGQQASSSTSAAAAPPQEARRVPVGPAATAQSVAPRLVQPVPNRNPVYAIPAPSSRPQVVVPVAYWIATPGPLTSAYQPMQPAFVHPSVPLASAADMDLQDMMSEEERKAKHREVQRRFVQRKKEQMERVRREAARLEKRHACLKLNLEQLSLEKENEELNDRVIDDDDMQLPTQEEILRYLEQECVVAKEAYEPMNDDDYSEILRETMNQVGEIGMRDSSKLDESTKVQVMGWTGRRVIEPGSESHAVMRFEIVKEFLRAKPEDIVDRAWAQITTSDGYRRFFSTSAPIKVRLLQTINDEAMVIFKSIFNPRTAAVQHSLDVVCRINVNDELLIVSRGIDAPSVRAALQDPTGWYSSLSVLGFATPSQSIVSGPLDQPTPRREPGTSCIFRFNSSIRSTSEMNLRYWLMEIVFILIRFETTVVAPLFVLAPA